MTNPQADGHTILGELPDGWVEVQLPDEFIKAYNEMNAGVLTPVPPRRYVHERNGLSVIITRDDLSLDYDDESDPRWHLSMVGPSRVPTWNEMSNACHALRPGVPFVMGIPPRSWWINVHDDCLHAWEVKDPNLTDQWRAERQGHAPH
jgi:hypothetical protein